MARLTAKDGVVEIVPSDSGIKVLKEKDGVKTIEVDTPFNPSDITENLQQGKPEPIRPPQAKGIRKALRGGGRAYGQNS